MKLAIVRKLSLLATTFVLVTAFGNSAFIDTAFADGTHTWEQSKFDELSKGTATGVAIRSVGGLELAPAFKQVYATPSTYIWAIASDDAGNVYAATGAPARVYRITPSGQTTIIFEPQELQVQALQVGPGGVIYAATAPDGKVYKLEHKGGAKAEAPKSETKANEKEPAKPTVDSSWTSSVYFAPGTKYIWDLALDRNGNLYVGTGDHGEIYKVSANGDHSLFFKSDETHIRVLAIDPQGNVIAGSDGSGLIYRISPAGEGFVLYSAPKKEITALALDRAGNIYAAGVGEKHAGSGIGSAAMLTIQTAPQIPTGAQAPGLTISPQPSTIPIAPLSFPGSGATGGSDIYRIAPDGSPVRVWTSHDDIVYALAFDSQNRLLAGTGNRGHIFAINGIDDYTDLLKAPASQVTAFAKSPGGALYAASSNLGKVFSVGASVESDGTFESDVFDAKIFSRWGRADFRGAGNVDMYARSGNVDNPDRNWSPWNKVDLAKGSEMGVPAARFAQWKAVMHSGSTKPMVDSVTLYYLPKNVAPVIDDVTVTVGTRYQPLPKSTLSSAPDVSGSSGGHFESPVPSSHDRDAIGVKWSAHDENDDQLVYSLYYRGDNDTRWLLLKDNITDKAYSFDASLLPDGGYTVRVVASDAPSHSPGEALTAQRESNRFEVDTTPPRIENLTGTLEGSGNVRVRFRADDSFSTIKRAEYSIDAGDWKYIDPADQISDAKTENYDFKIPLNKDDGGANLEHIVVVRVYDRYDNMDSAKAVVRGK